jgi:hypothetical protein
MEACFQVVTVVENNFSRIIGYILIKYIHIRVNL